jgi:2-octaprenyl-6-methoxyphenol hydroxylase
MKVCIIGDGLTSLTLAKALVNQGVYVHIFTQQKLRKKNKGRTIGISKSNLDFFNKNILNIKRLSWDIKKIEIYTENLKNERLLNFKKDDKTLFSLIENDTLYENLFLSLKKNKFFKFKKKIYNINFIEKNYDLAFICDVNSLISKKFFFKKLTKDYNSYAYTGIIDHKKIDNFTASQIFTKKGPFAFLPISNKQTSVVFSARGEKNINLKKFVEIYNKRYDITNLREINKFNLKSFTLRSYHFKNMLAFGDLLHKIHPLAGQGFNMSIRDIKEVVELIKFKINLGLDLDSSVCTEFEKKTKTKNFLFMNGVDFIYELFKFESALNQKFLSKSMQLVCQNKELNKLFIKYADTGSIF